MNRVVILINVVNVTQDAVAFAEDFVVQVAVLAFHRVVVVMFRLDEEVVCDARSIRSAQVPFVHFRKRLYFALYFGGRRHFGIHP